MVGRRVITPTWDPNTRTWYNREEGEDTEALDRGRARDTTNIAKKVKPASVAAGFRPAPRRPDEDQDAYVRRIARERREHDAKARP